MGGGYDFSGSGSTANSADIGGGFSVTDNSGGDLITQLSQPNSPGSTAQQTPGTALNWYLVGGILAVAAGVVFYFVRKKS